MAGWVERPFRREEPSALERQVLAEKVTGLSDLEVSAKLMVSERFVRSIVRQHGRELLNGFAFPQRFDGRHGAEGVGGNGASD
jgi:hypothetical protein